MKRIGMLTLCITFVFLISTAFAEVTCHDEPGPDKCEQACDGNGQNCETICLPTTRQVCVEVSPPPQSTQPAGGLTKGGGWGGVTIPVNPK